MPVSGPAGTVAIVRARSELAHSPLGPRDAVDVRRRPIPGSQLYGFNPYDPVVTLVAVVMLGLSALVASLIPALRASLLSPLETLRAGKVC